MSSDHRCAEQIEVGKNWASQFTLRLESRARKPVRPIAAAFVVQQIRFRSAAFWAWASVRKISPRRRWICRNQATTDPPLERRTTCAPIGVGTRSVRLDVNLDRTVFGVEDDPITGQTASRTSTGSGMTIEDRDSPATFYGVSPTLNYLGQGASQAMPTRQTFVGADPAPVDPAPANPYDPVTPAPTPIDTPPNGVQVDVGNTELSPTELTNLFSGFMRPQRTSQGKNAGRVIV